VLTWQPLTRSFAGCAEPQSPVVHGRQWPALVPGQDGHGAGGRDWPPTIAASQQLPSGCRWLLTWHHLGSPRIAATTVRSSGRSGGMPTHWRWLGTAVARLDPSKWQAAATRTSCEITGSRAGSGGDPAVWHHHRPLRCLVVGWGGGGRAAARARAGAGVEAETNASAKWELGAGSWELGAGSWELGAGSWELGAGSWEPEPEPERQTEPQPGDGDGVRHPQRAEVTAQQALPYR
jgi:hypothetical protein